MPPRQTLNHSFQSLFCVTLLCACESRKLSFQRVDHWPKKQLLLWLTSCIGKERKFVHVPDLKLTWSQWMRCRDGSSIPLQRTPAYREEAQLISLILYIPRHSYIGRLKGGPHFFIPATIILEWIENFVSRPFTMAMNCSPRVIHHQEGMHIGHA